MSVQTEARPEPLASVYNRLKTLTNLVGFYRDELKLYERRLEEVAVRNTAHDVLAQVEHFQNRFILQRDQLDHLAHDIGLRKQKLEELAKLRDMGALRVDDEGLEAKCSDFTIALADTKARFYRFLAEVY